VGAGLTGLRRGGRCQAEDDVVHLVRRMFDPNTVVVWTTRR